MLERMRSADRSDVMTVTVVVGSYRPLPEPTEVMCRAAQETKARGFRAPAKLYVYDTLLRRLPQDLQDKASKLG